MLEKLFSFCSPYQIKKYVIFISIKNTKRERNPNKEKLRDILSEVLSLLKKFIKK